MKSVLYKILWSTIEDYVGLWEISWELNSLLPDYNSDKNEKVAKKILTFFVEQDLIDLYFNVWGNDEIKQINKVEASQLIKEEDFWKAPSINDLCIKVGNTEKGKAVYDQKLLTNFDLEYVFEND